MKTRLVTLSLAAIIAVTLACEGIAAYCFEQGNASQSEIAATLYAAAPSAQTAQAPPPAPAPRPRAQRPRRRPRGETGGIPKGMENCLNALAKLAQRDPLIDYEGRPSQIINDGLLWNDPKAKCPVGDDQPKRLKIFELATAWRTKDAAKVRSLLQELGATADGGR